MRLGALEKPLRSESTNEHTKCFISTAASSVQLISLIGGGGIMNNEPHRNTPLIVSPVCTWGAGIAFTRPTHIHQGIHVHQETAGQPPFET
jgi:hypothetical protein